MNLAFARLSVLVASLAACGAAVVPVGPGDASAGDATQPAADQVTPPGDVSLPPPPRDVPPPPPPPPRDAGPASITSLCMQACERQARECGAASQQCAPQCAQIQSAPGVDRCIEGVVRALECLVRDGFVCRSDGSGEVPASCRALFESVQRCIDRGDPPPVIDAGGPDV